MAHQQRCQQKEDDDECIEHTSGAQLIKIILAVDAQIDGEQQNDDKDIEDLAQYRQRRLAGRVVFPILLELGFRHWVGILLNDVAMADFFLAHLFVPPLGVDV